MARDNKALYHEWLASVSDDELKAQLLSMDDEAIDDAFFSDLSFGTGGLRGVMAAGTNKMNVYTVAKATRGLARYILASCPNQKKVAIGYDSRNNSERFAKLAAAILADMGIKVYIWSELLPTPMLSFAVRAHACSIGIMLTASHNPAEYNGYKVYREDGCQITEAMAEEISAYIAKENTFIETISPDFDALLDSGMIEYIKEEVYEDFMSAVMKNSLWDTRTDAVQPSIVYTPLNGTGRRPVLDILARRGFEKVNTVREQLLPDGNFPTCPYPNPEIPTAMALGLSYAEETGADILLATDPDCDRVGVGARTPSGNYTLLTGNEIGLLLLEFICQRRMQCGTMPKSPVVVKTIVTTDIAPKIAQAYGASMVDVLTGFKYIGEVIGKLEIEGRDDDYIFGFEESCGYLTSGYVRDKDGVLAAMLVAEATAYYASLGKNLCEALDDIYKKYGYAKSSLKSYTFEGPTGFARMQAIMQKLRRGIDTIGGLKVEKTLDFKEGIEGLPKSDVLKFLLEGNSTLVVRPSGTEPKLKVYFSIGASDEESATALADIVAKEIENYIL